MKVAPVLNPLRSGEKLAVLLPGMGAVATTAIAGRNASAASVRAQMEARSLRDRFGKAMRISPWERAVRRRPGRWSG